MAEEFGDDVEKSEEPTPKRREEARKQGQFAKSRNLIPAATLGAIVIALRLGGEHLIDKLGRCIVGFFALAGNVNHLNPENMMAMSLETGLLFVPVMLPMFVGIMLSGLGSGFLQTGFVMASEPLRFDFKRINPTNGLRRLFSLDSVADSIKATLFIVVLGFIGAIFLYHKLPELMSLPSLTVGDISTYASLNGVLLSGWIISAMVAITAFDYLYQRWRIDKQLRMSRQELKEELREQEGHPQLRAHLRGLRQKLSRRRMMNDVSKADVVITNPTRLAIALRYRAEEMVAPRVVGKGAGFMAKKIREVARERTIPLVENKPLARLLYSRVEVGREIPESLYRAVAGVLAYVYRFRRGSHTETSKIKALRETIS